MRFHMKRRSLPHQVDHHHLKRRPHHMKGKHHFGLMRAMMVEDVDRPCKWKRLAAGKHGHKWRHFKGLGRDSSSSSSDSEDDDHHFKHFRGRGMKGSGENHDGKRKHAKGWWKKFISESPEGVGDNCMSETRGHHGKREYFNGMKRRCMSEGQHGPGKHGHCMSDVEEGHHGRREHFNGMKGRCMSEGPQGPGKHSKGKHGHCMSDIEEGHHGRRNNLGSRQKGCMSEGPGQHSNDMRRHCMSDVEGHHSRDHFDGMRKGPHGKHFRGMHGHGMSDIEGRHGRKNFKSMRGRYMSDSDEEDHGRRKHMLGMMRHYRGRHGMKGYGKRGFFDEDSALVPICVDDEGLNTQENKNASTSEQSPVNAEEVSEESSKTREQGTQTTGIMEIVIEDQEAQSAAIRIVNKFL